MCLISVIVPVFNREALIERCIESICAQTLSDIEIILVDDGSTDLTGVICDRLSVSDDRIHVIHRMNGGAAEARNAGMKYAKGKYIMFLDSDDCFIPDYCEKMYNLQEKYGDKTLCVSGLFFKRYKDGVIFSEHCGDSKKKEEILKSSDILKLYKMGLLNSAVNKIYKRDIIVREGLIQPADFKIGEDTVFVYGYIKALCMEEIVIVNTTSYNANIHDDFSLMKSFCKDYYKIMLYIYHSLEQLCTIYKAPKCDEKILNGMFWDIVYYALKNTMHKDNKVSFLKKMKENKGILSSDAVQKHLSEECKGGYLGKWRKRAYRTRSYVIVLVYEHIASMIRK